MVITLKRITPEHRCVEIVAQRCTVKMCTWHPPDARIFEALIGQIVEDVSPDQPALDFQ